MAALLNGRRASAAVARRALVAFVAVCAGGVSLRLVAEVLGVSPPTVLRGVRAGPAIMKRIGVRPEELVP